MNNNNNNSENRRSSATDWELETANTLCDAFENKIAFEKILDLLQEKQSVDQVVDSLFSLIRAPESQQLPLQEEKEEEEEEEEEETERVILIEEEEEVEEDQEDQEEEEEEEQVLERSEISVEEEEEEEEEEAEEEEYDSAKESIPEEIEENYEDVFASQTSLVELKDKYTVDSSTLSTSVYNEIPLSQSIMTTIRTIAKTAEEKTVQTDENNVRFFQERIESLSLQLDAATEAKIKVEEEKKNALKFCVTQVTAIKESMAEKEELIAKQEQEIAQLRKQLEESKNVPSSESKFEKYFSDSKVALIQGVETLSQQITENIAKVHAEFRNEDKEWVIMKRLQEFATEFRKEMNDLFSKNSLPPRAPIVIQPALEKEKANEDEEKDFWQTEKASLESYIKELEDRLKFYEDQEKAKNDSLFSSITSASDLLVESLSNATTYGSSLLDAPSVSSFEQSNPNFLDSTPSQQSAQPVQQPAHQPVQPQLQPFIFPPPVSDIWGPVYPSSPPQPFNHYWRVNPPTVPSYPSSFGYSQYPPHNPNYRNY